MTKRLGIAFLTLGLCWAAQGATETWEIDTGHTTAAFKVRHMMVSWVRGHFAGVTGTVKLDDKDMKAMTVEATIDAKTVNTNNEKRDEHLRNADFFNVEKFPTLTFKSKKVVPGKGTFKIIGDLTLVGTTKEVTLNGSDLSTAAKDPWGGMRRGFSATTKINRKDFGLTWNKALDGGGILVGDDVEVTVDVEMIKKAEPKS